MIGLARADDAHPPDVPFPTLPDASERVAKNEAEIDAGLVALESVLEISGTLSWKGKTPDGEITQRWRHRFLVLDSTGAELLETYGYPDENLANASQIAGRTVLQDGTVHPLDPVEDVRRIDMRDPRGGPPRAVPSVVFPQVRPGAILDLSWTENVRVVPSLTFVPLQKGFPVRKARVQVKGRLQGGKTVIVPTPIVIAWSSRPGYYWVPFFVGAVPPRARVTLSGDFDLDLEVADLPPAKAEPFEPSPYRTGYVLGLMPRKFGARKKVSEADWRDHLVIFGTPGSALSARDARTISAELDPDRSIVRLDDLGLQVLPEGAWAGMEFLEPLQGHLRDLERTFDAGWSIDGRDRAQIESIAPPDLPWKERARRLYRHARDQVRLDPGGPDHETLSDLRKDGRGTPRDRTFYLAGLLKGAGIRARIARALSRFTVPFHPIVGQNAPFDPAWLLEVGPSGTTPVYVAPGDRCGSFGSLPAAYVGGLAFLQPGETGSNWLIERLPLDSWMNDASEVELRAEYAPGVPEVDLNLRSMLRETAAARFREQLDPADQDPPAVGRGSGGSRTDVFAAWVRRWTGSSWSGIPPDTHPNDNEGEPLAFDLRVTWRPLIERRGDRVDLPALPGADAFRNPFVEPVRSRPLWLDGGRSTVTLAWSLPGATPADLPPPVEKAGPRGLAFRMEVQVKEARCGGGKPDIVTTLALDVPYVLPASDYAAVKSFFEELERTASAKLTITVDREPVSRVGGADERRDLSQILFPRQPDMWRSCAGQHGMRLDTAVRSAY